MVTSNFRPRVRPVPDHVPADLIREFSFWASPGMDPERDGDPYGALSVLRDLPRIFYAPGNTFDGHGCWMLTHAEDIREVLQDGVTYSSARKLFSPLVGEDWPLVPLEIDPPDHKKFRALMNPMFAPQRMNTMLAAIRARAIDMVEALKSRGSCNFTNEFAFPFAVSIFLQFLGLPQQRMPEFLRWAEDLLHGEDVKTRAAGAQAIVDYLRELIALRRREPGDDVADFMLKARVDGEPLNDDQIIGMGALLFVAGLDTVAAAISFDFNYLARNPQQQALLRAEPALIPDAVEELLRAYSTVHMVRVATRDVELRGVQIRTGDRVSCATMVANLDPKEFPDPDRIDLARQPNRHAAFSYGPHRCVGSHLARREVIVAIEEWLARVPELRIKTGTAPVVHAGFVFGIEDLELAWD